MENAIEPQRIIGLLADGERFKVAAAVSLGAETAAKITAMTGLSTAAVMKALVKLEEAGIIVKKDAGYTFDIGVLQALNREIAKTTPKKPVLQGIDRFFKDGKLVRYPKDLSDRTAVLERLAALFEYDRSYPEKEVNEKLKAVNPDFAALRRYLFDAGFFSRQRVEENCHTVTMYWRVRHL